jgi:hypothetical protein
MSWQISSGPFEFSCANDSCSVEVLAKDKRCGMIAGGRFCLVSNSSSDAPAACKMDDTEARRNSRTELRSSE